MKRTRLVRHKPLRATQPLRVTRGGSTDARDGAKVAQRLDEPASRACPVRRSPIRRQSPKRRKAQTAWNIARMVAYARSAGRCEICGTPIAANAFEAHHRKRRTQGGTDAPSNLLALCPGPAGCHHARAHGDRTAAERAGWIVRRANDPASTPVLLAGWGVVLLGESGYEPVRGAA